MSNEKVKALKGVIEQHLLRAAKDLLAYGATPEEVSDAIGDSGGFGCGMGNFLNASFKKLNRGREAILTRDYVKDLDDEARQALTEDKAPHLQSGDLVEVLEGPNTGCVGDVSSVTSRGVRVLFCHEEGPVWYKPEQLRIKATRRERKIG